MADFTVSFDTRGGSQLRDRIYTGYEQGDDILVTLPDASEVTKEGCTLIGWISDIYPALFIPVGESTTTIQAQNCTFSAFYNLDFTFDYGDITEFSVAENNTTLKNTTVNNSIPNFADTLFIPDPVRDGYTFLYWRAKEDPEITSSMSNELNIRDFTRGYTMEAVWQSNTPEQTSNVYIKTETGWKVGTLKYKINLNTIKSASRVYVKTAAGWK